MQAGAVWVKLQRALFDVPSESPALLNKPDKTESPERSMSEHLEG